MKIAPVTASTDMLVRAKPAVSDPGPGLGERVKSPPALPTGTPDIQAPVAKRRKRKAQAERKTEFIGATCTKAEYELIKSAAKLVGLKAGPYLVDSALKKTADIIATHNFFVETKMEQIVEKVLRRLPTANP